MTGATIQAAPRRREGAAETALRIGGRPAVRAASERVAAVLARDAAEHDQDGTLPERGIEAVWAEGLGNLGVPASYGGVGAGLESTLEAIRILAGGDPSVALVLVMHLVHTQLIAAPSTPVADAVRLDVLSTSLAGPALSNALRVEPELGTPARGGVPATRAVRTPEGYRISGRKTFSTGSYGLHWLFVWAATEDDDPDGVRSGTFLVPAFSRGVRVIETWDHLGMRATASHDIVLDDVAIPADYAWDLRAPGNHPPYGGDPVLTGWMNLLVPAVYHGIAVAARDWLALYLHERVPTGLGAPLATLPRFQQAVGEIEALLVASDELLRAHARRIDHGEDLAATATATPLVKSIVTGNAIRAVERAVGLVGNAGLSRRNPLERHYRDVLCGRIHTPQDDVVLTTTGSAVLAAARASEDQP